MKAYLPNTLSLIRIALIIPLLFVDRSLRFPIFVLAMISDFLDGYLARKWEATSKLGAIIDPIGDKGLFLTLCYLYWNESALSLSDVFVIFLRDFVITAFALYLLLARLWQTWTIRSFWCGKIATCLQGLMFLYIIYDRAIPLLLKEAMIATCTIAPFELYYLATACKPTNCTSEPL